MADPFFQFHWEVPVTGFRWVERKEDGEARWVLAHHEPAARPAPTRRYAPLREYTGLFRTFAATPTTKAGILAFANRYGRLGTRDDASFFDPSDSKPGGKDFYFAEYYSSWVEAVSSMHYAVTLWDFVQQRDKAGLSRYVRWQDTKTLVFKRDGKWTPAPPFPTDLQPALVPGEIVLPALFYVQRQLNLHIERVVSPAVLFTSEYTRLSIYLMPDTLLDALWLQFAQAVTGNQEYRQCQQCGEWFEIDHDITRSNRVFCSNACRSKAYRSRQDKAHQLAAAGVSATAIAEQLGTDRGTVEKWIVRPQAAKKDKKVGV